MWCHLCTKDYPDFEDFRIHIMQMHRNSTEFCKDSSESEESEHENADASEVNNDENKSDDNIAALNNSLKKCNDNESYNTSVLNTSSRKYSDNEDEFDDNASVLNTLTRKYDDDNKSDINTSILNTSSRKRNVNENESDVSRTALNQLPKKCKKTSILKKRVQRKKKKAVFSKKVLPKRKKSTASYKEDLSEHSEENETNHLESSVKTDIKQESVDSDPVLNNNYANSQSVPTNNYVISQSAPNNNPVFLVNPYGGQGANNYVIGTQAIQPSVYVVNPVITKPVATKNGKGFDFSSKNILKWLTKHKELCKNIQYPLPTSLFNQVKAVHKGIFDHYCTASVSEESSAVMKVYEELDCMIHKHINSINNALSVL